MKLPEEKLLEKLGLTPADDKTGMILSALHILEFHSRGKKTAAEDTREFRAARVLVESCDNPAPEMLVFALVHPVISRNESEDIAAVFNQKTADIVEKMNNYVVTCFKEAKKSGAEPDTAFLADELKKCGPEAAQFLIASRTADIEQKLMTPDRDTLAPYASNAVLVRFLGNSGAPKLETRFAAACNDVTKKLELLEDKNVAKTVVFGKKQKPGVS